MTLRKVLVSSTMVVLRLWVEEKQQQLVFAADAVETLTTCWRRGWRLRVDEVVAADVDERVPTVFDRPWARMVA